MSYYIGLDLGGTNIKAGVVSAEQRTLARTSIPTPGNEGVDAVIEAMAGAALSVAADAGLAMDRVAGVGIGSPGPFDYDRGVVIALPNLPGWKRVPLRDRIAELVRRPAILENDANAAAFGEFWAGAGRDPSIRHLVMMTLGTGIGTGLVVDGKLIHGAFGGGGEGGHVIVQPEDGRLCGCGQHGCLEAYASASSTARIAEERVRGDLQSTLDETYRVRGRLSAKDVFDAAAAGDGLANQIVDETAGWLALACLNLTRLLDPQMIVFAGGMILAGDLLFNRVRRAIGDLNWNVDEIKARIVPAVLGNDAGFIGAAAVAWDAHQSGRLGVS